MYTAAVLTPMSADLLKWIMRGSLRLEDEGFAVENSQGEPLPHHMTICMGPIDKSDLHGRGILGCEADLTFDSLIYNHALGVCAVPIIKATCLWTSGNGKYDPLPLKSANAYPHITVCIKPESKPRFSNQMLETPHPDTVVTELDQSHILKARIREVGA
jgi:hypothetical protein